MLPFLMAVLIYLKKPLWRYYAGVAVYYALAVGSKYSGFVVIPPLLFAHLSLSHHSYSLKSIYDKKLIIAGLLIIVTFLATTPFAALDFMEFYHDLRFGAHHYSKGHVAAAADTVSYINYAELLTQ